MRKIKNTKNTTLYSTLLPRLTSLSHKKPAKTQIFHPRSPCRRPPATRLPPACFPVLSANIFSENRRPPVNHRNPPGARLFLTESLDFTRDSAGARRRFPSARRSPARSISRSGFIPDVLRRPPVQPSVACHWPHAPFCPCLHTFGGPTPLVTWIDDVSTHGRRLRWIGCSLYTYWGPPPLLTMVIDRYFLPSTLKFHFLSCLHSLRTMHGLSVGE